MVIDSEAGKLMYRLRNADTSFLSLALALLVPEWRNGGRNSGRGALGVEGHGLCPGLSPGPMAPADSLPLADDSL